MLHASARDECDCRCRDRHPRSEELGPGDQVAARRPDRAADLDGLVDETGRRERAGGVATAGAGGADRIERCGRFDRDHRVRTVGESRAGRDAGGGARSHRDGRSSAGGDVADDAKGDRGGLVG